MSDTSRFSLHDAPWIIIAIYFGNIGYGGPGSVVGIATAYGLDGPGIESRWGEIFSATPDRP